MIPKKRVKSVLDNKQFTYLKFSDEPYNNLLNKVTRVYTKSNGILLLKPAVTLNLEKYGETISFSDAVDLIPHHANKKHSKKNYLDYSVAPVYDINKEESIVAIFDNSRHTIYNDKNNTNSEHPLMLYRTRFLLDMYTPLGERLCQFTVGYCPMLILIFNWKTRTLRGLPHDYALSMLINSDIFVYGESFEGSLTRTSVLPMQSYYMKKENDSLYTVSELLGVSKRM